MNPPISTTYTVTGTNANNCTNTAQAIVKVNALPVTPVIIQHRDTLFSNAPAGNQWYKTSGSISGAVNSDYIPTASDDYYVITTINGCIFNKSNNIQVVISGISEKEMNENIIIYPNPTSNKFIIEMDNQKDSYNLEIFNTIGQIILNKRIFNSFEQIDLSDQSAGIYFVKIQSAKNTMVKKIIKQN